jgi:hypothetical protein
MTMLQKSSFRRFGLGTAATLLAFSLPALAADNQPAPAKSGAEQRYCMVTTLSGSRIPKRICMTREQWLRQGVDPLAKD